MIVAAAAMHLTLLPIAPLILLPFALIFFVVVFPFWGVALGILGLVLLILRGINAIARIAGWSRQQRLSRLSLVCDLRRPSGSLAISRRIRAKRRRRKRHHQRAALTWRELT